MDTQNRHYRRLLSSPISIFLSNGIKIRFMTSNSKTKRGKREKEQTNKRCMREDGLLLEIYSFTDLNMGLCEAVVLDRLSYLSDEGLFRNLARPHHVPRLKKLFERKMLNVATRAKRIKQRLAKIQSILVGVKTSLQMQREELQVRCSSDQCDEREHVTTCAPLVTPTHCDGKVSQLCLPFGDCLGELSLQLERDVSVVDTQGEHLQ